MSVKKALILVILAHLVSTIACAYIVLPEGVGSESGGSGEWAAVVTNIDTSESDSVRIGISIRNDTGDWSAMQAIAENHAVLQQSDGTDTICETVFVSSGGHRLAPGFQMRGYIAGTLYEPITQLIYVECPVSDVPPESMLLIDYVFFTGQYNYYEPEANQAEGTFELNLDEIQTDMTYPVAYEVEDIVLNKETEINAINDVSLTLTGIQRIDNGLEFAWETYNPGEYPSYVHIGNPPVIGNDGILYGYYETPDIVSVPVTPADGVAEWTTEVAVPQDVTGLYIMLSVESGKQRLFANYAIDITEE
jgi:hypothetical protein